MAGVDAGEWVDCPACGTHVLGKSMIPVLAESGSGIRYLCVSCARTHIQRPDADRRGPSTGDDLGAGPAAAEPDTDLIVLDAPGGADPGLRPTAG